MRRFISSSFSPFWIGLLGFLLICVPPANGQTVIRPTQPPEQVQAVWRELASANVIYLSEIHDRPEIHQAQFEIIQTLHRRRTRKLAIGLEMFQRPFQPLLDRYLAGEISEEQLRKQSEYDTRWGFDWEFYAPILRFARAHQIPVIALNTPTEITRKVARQGLESLTPAEKKWIPPLSEIRTDHPEYRRQVQEIYEAIHQGKNVSRGFEQFFLAQVLWDETMADRVAHFVKAHPNHQLIVLAGQMHIAYGYGIPSRVQRRMGARRFQQRSIVIPPAQESPPTSSAAIADYLWMTTD